MTFTGLHRPVFSAPSGMLSFEDDRTMQQLIKHLTGHKLGGTFS